MRACIFASIILICFADSIKKLVKIFLAVYAAEKRLADYVPVLSITYVVGNAIIPSENLPASLAESK